MIYAQIENNTVANILSADETGAASLIATGMVLIGTEKPVAIGDSYAEGFFTRAGAPVLTREEEQAQLIATYEEALTVLGALPLEGGDSNDAN